MFKNIRRKLTLLYVLIMALFFIALVFGTYESMKWSITSEQEREVLLFAEEEAYEHSILFQHREVFAEQGDYKDGSGRMYFYAFNAAGELVNAARPAEDFEPEILARIADWDVPVGDVLVFRSNISSDREEIYELMMASMPIIIDGKEAGTVYVGRDVTAVFNGLKKSTAIMGAFSLLALFLSAIVGYVMAGRAIIPLKQAYERQRQFAADASHELRTPLSVVMSSVDVLQNDPEITSPFLKQVMADMKDEIKKMAKLVGDLLIIARSDGELTDMVKENFSLTLVAEEVIRKMQPLALQKNVKLFFAERHVVEMYADLAKIQRLLLILIDNAIKYTPEGGMVTVKLERQRETDSLKITVKDTGIGIPEDQQAKVFERFYRVDKSRSRATGGTGLGLAIAKRIVELHAGKIFVKSQPGQGAAFVVVIPL